MTSEQEATNKATNKQVKISHSLWRLDTDQESHSHGGQAESDTI